MKTIHYALCVVSLTMTSSLFISGCSAKSGLEEKAWFQYASEYDCAMRQMWASDGLVGRMRRSDRVWKDWMKVLKIQQDYIQSLQPLETEIVSVLRSPNRKHQRVALVAMSIKPVETDQTTDVLFEFLQDNDPAFRWYTLEALVKFSHFSQARQADLGGTLLEIVKTRTDDELSPREFTLLARFPSEKAAQFLTELLLREEEEIPREREKSHISTFRYLAFKALKEMGSSYYDKAVEDVHKHGSPEIKKAMLSWEKLLEEQNISR